MIARILSSILLVATLGAVTLIVGAVAQMASAARCAPTLPAKDKRKMWSSMYIDVLGAPPPDKWGGKGGTIREGAALQAHRLTLRGVARAALARLSAVALRITRAPATHEGAAQRRLRLRAARHRTPRNLSKVCMY